MTLVKAIMCEQVKKYVPYNPAIVFSTGIGRVYCFTSFDPVLRETVVYHQWFYKDRLIRTRKLSLHPPRWSTLSNIELREADKGPWHVEITDAKGHVIRVLRFSITD